MVQLNFRNILAVVFFVFIGSTSEANLSESKGDLFQRLSNVGIDQVVELPYNKSLVANLGRQVKIHNVAEMEDGALPKPTSLREEFYNAHDSYIDRTVLPALSYKVGRGECAYMEAIKVSEVLVCYKSARENSSLLAPVSRYSDQNCTTASAQLSHCYIFAHSVDEVVAAISN